MLSLFNFKTKKPDWSFQQTAISSLVNDFQRDPAGRFLLVLPTGGGKTLTAIRTLDALLSKKFLSKNDKVLWVVHTIALKSLAQKNFAKEDHYNDVKFSLNRELRNIVNVRMKAEAQKELASGVNYKLIIIDEAHHAAADTYNVFFDYPIGILGLTATPRRMDLKSLPFKKVSYSITFRELVRRKVVLLPKFLPEVQTNVSFDITSLEEQNQLEKFNNEERNRLVSRCLFDEAKRHNLKKVIVFAGTNEHVKKLYESIKNENELSGNPFKHIGYIYGGDSNEKGLRNEDYLEWHQTQDSSVLVNCRILNEGYDDQNIDTVVMATPTNSILYYLQCIGRVVRTPQGKSDAKAYVIEIVDRLPNVSYRIDNRWLFSEISDYLEPLIVDIKGFTPMRIIKTLFKLLSYGSKLSDLKISEWRDLLLGRRINFVLFNDVPYNKRGVWRIMSMPEGNSEKIQLFNDLSENINEYYEINHEYLFRTKYQNCENYLPADKRVYISSLMAALNRAYQKKIEKKPVDSIIYLSVN